MAKTSVIEKIGDALQSLRAPRIDKDALVDAWVKDQKADLKKPESEDMHRNYRSRSPEPTPKSGKSEVSDGSWGV